MKPNLLGKLAGFLVPDSLFLLDGAGSYHLKHYARGLGRHVEIGSAGPLVRPELPPTIGYLTLRSLHWSFTPAVGGVIVNGAPAEVGTPSAIRHLSSVSYGPTTFTFVIAGYHDYHKMVVTCPFCSGH